MPGWDTRRPVYHRLPQAGYQASEPGEITVTDALTAPVDGFLMLVGGLIDSVEADYLNPETAKAANLDWLAQLCGFTGEYWDLSWSEAIKRQLIKDAYTFVWRHKGSTTLLTYLLNLFAIRGKVHVVGAFVLSSSKLGQPLGYKALEYLVLMPLDQGGYLRNSYEWILVKRFIRLYMPCFARGRVVYNRFKLGFSTLGEPLLRLG